MACWNSRASDQSVDRISQHWVFPQVLCNNIQIQDNGPNSWDWAAVSTAWSTVWLSNLFLYICNNVNSIVMQFNRSCIVCVLTGWWERTMASGLHCVIQASHSSATSHGRSGFVLSVFWCKEYYFDSIAFMGRRACRSIQRFWHRFCSTTVWWASGP